MGEIGSNLTLNSLNLYWFSKMVQAIRKRFETPKETAGAQPLTAGPGSEKIIKENGVRIDAEYKVLVEGTELEVPYEIVETVEKKTGGSIRKRKA